MLVHKKVKAHKNNMFLSTCDVYVCMCVCIYIYIHTYTHTHTHTHTRVYNYMQLSTEY